MGRFAALALLARRSGTQSAQMAVLRVGNQAGCNSATFQCASQRGAPEGRDGQSCTGRRSPIWQPSPCVGSRDSAHRTCPDRGCTMCMQMYIEPIPNGPDGPICWIPHQIPRKPVENRQRTVEAATGQRSNLVQRRYTAT